MSDRSRLKIVGDLTNANTRVLLNDTDITDMVSELQVRFAAAEIVTATITIVPNEVDIDAEALAKLIAVVNDPNHKRAV